MRLCVWSSAPRVTTAALILLLLFGTAGESGAQSKIPIPEFYGVYLVSDGKLINLDLYEAKSQNRLKAPGMTLLSFAKMGIAPLSGLVASPDSYVLMYLQGPTVPMNLGRFEYVERLTVGTGTPLEPKRIVDARMWQLKANIPVNVGPVAGKQDLIRLVPAKPLADGVYAWYIGSLETMGIMNEVVVSDFVVGKVPQTPPDVAREVPQASSPQPGGPTGARRPESVGLDERFEKLAANLLTDPTTQDIRLTGLTPSPHASGRIVWNARAGAGLLVSGLPPLPPGRTYQLWAIVGNKPPVSAGVFTVDASGSGGLSVRPLPGVTVVNAIAVTQEPAGGLPQPSGEMYLMSSIGAAQTPTSPARGTSSPQSPSASGPSASGPAVPGAPSVAGGGPPLASLPPQQPVRPKLTDLTRGTPNDSYFVESQKVFNRGYESVWVAAKKVLERRDPLNPAGDRISTENREQGTLITEPTIHSRFLAAKIRRQYFIVIDSGGGTNSTVVTVKGFCYEQRGQQWVSSLPRDRCSAGFLEDLEKELAKVGQGSTTPSGGSAAAPPVSTPKPDKEVASPLGRGTTAVLVIDGISGAMTELLGKAWGIGPLSPPASQNYLYVAIRSYLDKKGVSMTMDPIPWGGLTKETQNALPVVKAYIFSRAQTGQGGLTIVAHSWGSVLVYAALQDLAESGQHVTVDNLVTLGSPVGYFPRLSESVCSSVQSLKQTGAEAVTATGKLAVSNASQKAMCDSTSLGRYRSRPVTIPPSVKQWTNWFADGDGVSTFVSDGRVANRMADDLRRVGDLAGNHAQYFAWSYGDGKTEDDQKIRLNASRVLEDLSKVR